MNTNLLERLKNACLIADGAMGTYFGQKYVSDGRVSEMANITNPGLIESIHMEYIMAGADMIRTNSFACNSSALSGHMMRGGKDRRTILNKIYEHTYAAYHIAEGAVYKSSRDILIAADIGPVPEYGSADEQDIMAEYYKMADAFIDCGAGLIWFETFSDFNYILPAADYIKSKSDAVIMASFCLNKFGYTKSGIGAKHILKTAAQSGLIDCVGFNCGIGSAHMYQVLKGLDLGSMPVSVMPNSGYPDIIQDRNVYQENISYFCDNMKAIAGLGVNILGGCCGTNPSYIRALKQAAGRTKAAGRKHFVYEAPGERRVNKTHNSFLNKLCRGEKPVIVELDPPHDGNPEKIVAASSLLKQAGVDLVTFSDSPMGKMRADSMMAGAKIQRELEIPVMPHVSCRDRNVIAMGSAFMGAHMNGIRNMLIVTGDPVPASDRNIVTAVYDFNAVKLMEYFGRLNQEYFPEDPVIYGGALNYGRANIEKEIDRMKKKCAAGADYFLTQPVYSDTDIDKIKYIKSKTDTKILCGILPLVSYRNAMFMKNEIYGIHVPDEIVARYNQNMSRGDGEAEGIEIACELAEKLSDTADGYYFMVPFNRASMICRIIERMKQACLI